MEHILDNPVWNALNTGNASLACGDIKAKYLPADIAFFVGTPNISAESFDALYQLVPSGVWGYEAMDEISIPAPWVVVRPVKVLQLVHEGDIPEQDDTGLIPLASQHVPQMIALTKLTDPGPFLERTINLGHYFGIFDGAKLVAMAGQRMNPVPYAEISAVCTHPDYLGKGYASKLLLFHIKRIKTAGQIPFLHVLPNNLRAIQVYERLGFVARKDAIIYVIKKEASQS